MSRSVKNEPWKYYLEDDGRTVGIVDRMAKPRMQQVIDAMGGKWQVWYIEQGAGVQNARCEPFLPLPSPLKE